MKTTIKTLIKIILSPFILPDYFKFKSNRFKTSIFDLYPQIKDKTITTGFDRHYVYHTSWAARVVKEINPEYHIDISSSLYFSGIVSAFVPIKFYDYRPANLILDNLESKAGNLHHLPFEDNSIQSISCMHTIEHIGLGRYGDQIDPDGDLKAVKELKRVVMKGGSLLIVVPIGIQKIEFNAHRIYNPQYIIDIVTENDEFILKEFTYIPEFEDKGGLQRNVNPKIAERDHYSCGCYWFIKK